MSISIGRNDPCPCGSGKKYKNCHLKTSISSGWKDVLEGIPFEHPQKEIIARTFAAMNNEYRIRPIAGGCHLLSGIHYILLNEQGVDAELCIGEVRHPNAQAFDHSWVEVDDRSFDVAIQQTDNGERHAPVYAGFDLDTGRPSKFNYRHKFKGLDLIGRNALETPLAEYMDGCPKKFGEWGGIESIAKRIDLPISVPNLRLKYQSVLRKFVQLQ